MAITKAEYEALKPYENTLYTAVYAKYIRVLRKDEYDAIYSVWRNYRKDSVCPSCTAAKLRMCQIVGAWYFEAKTEEENEPEKTESVEDSNLTPTGKPKGYFGRKKKASTATRSRKNTSGTSTKK